MIKITLLTEKDEEKYTNMLYNSNEAMFYHSIPFRNLLECFLSCKSYHIIAKENDKVIGCIPTFLKTNKKYGNILNSLPFFGSNGGFLIDSRLDNNKRIYIKKELLKKFVDIAHNNNCILSTIITSPFDKDFSFYEENLQYNFKDERIGQITEFKSKNVNDIENEIMYNIVEKRNRATIRKPLKCGITFEYSNDFRPLFEMHKEGMLNKEGIVKPLKFFQNVSDSLNNFNIIYAKKEGEIIAGLLLFYFKDTVEYFTPAFYLEHRKEQALSLLIFEEMKKAIKNGYKYWNWGGTGNTQKGVYEFKKGWGAKDYSYYYYISQYGNIDNILKLSQEALINEYKWFYVLPFNKLKKIT